MNFEISADGMGSAAAANASAGATGVTKLAAKDGADNDGETDKAGAVNELNGVNGMEIVPTSPTGVATRIWAEDGNDNDNAKAITAKRREPFTISQV